MVEGLVERKWDRQEVLADGERTAISRTARTVVFYTFSPPPQEFVSTISSTSFRGLLNTKLYRSIFRVLHFNFA